MPGEPSPVRLGLWSSYYRKVLPPLITPVLSCRESAIGYQQVDGSSFCGTRICSASATLKELHYVNSFFRNCKSFNLAATLLHLKVSSFRVRSYSFIVDAGTRNACLRAAASSINVRQPPALTCGSLLR